MKVVEEAECRRLDEAAVRLAALDDEKHREEGARTKVIEQEGKRRVGKAGKMKGNIRKGNLKVVPFGIRENSVLMWEGAAWSLTHMFSKELTHTDLNSSRFNIPKWWPQMEKLNQKVTGGERVRIKAFDLPRKVFVEFDHMKHKSSRSFCFANGLLDGLKKAELVEGDTISFFHGITESGNIQYFFDYHRGPQESVSEQVFVPSQAGKSGKSVIEEGNTSIQEEAEYVDECSASEKVESANVVQNPPLSPHGNDRGCCQPSGDAFQSDEDDEYLPALKADREKEMKAVEEAEGRRLEEAIARLAALGDKKRREEEARTKVIEQEGKRRVNKAEKEKGNIRKGNLKVAPREDSVLVPQRLNHNPYRERLRSYSATKDIFKNALYLPIYLRIYLPSPSHSPKCHMGWGPHPHVGTLEGGDVFGRYIGR